MTEAQQWSALENIPEEMKALPQWVCYKAIPKEGHWGKRIESPITRELARNNRPSDWSDYQIAVRYAQKNNLDGVAFTLTGGIVFIDMDEVGNKPIEIRKILASLSHELEGTYCETSVSGKGIHFFCKGKLPDRARKKNSLYGLEMYDTGRFACMSGRSIHSAGNLKDLTEKIGEINRRYIGEPYKETRTTMRRIATASDREIIEAIRSSRQGKKFDRLYGGDWSGYESQSSADFALLKMLTFWTQDEKQLDRIFRSSGLFRPKWDKSSGYYGKYQIANALRLTTVTRKTSMEM